MNIRILLADDQKIIRDGLRALIQAQADMEVVGEAPDGREAVQMTRRLRPDAIVMDVNMPVMDGITATRQIVAEDPQAKVLILSMQCGSSFDAAALGAGAKGCLAKDRVFQEFVEAIRSLAVGENHGNPDP